MRLVAPLLSGCFAAMALVHLMPRAAAQQPTPKARLSVDWNDPAVLGSQSGSARAAAPGASQGAFRTQQSNVDKLKIPVLGFVEAPEIARRVMGAGARETAAPELVFDPSNPIWFHLEQHFGDVTVTVDADLRVDRSASDAFRTQPAAGGRVAATSQQQDSRISVLEEGAQQGEGGVMANYTVYRFPNIAYAVTIACSGALQKACRDTAVIKRDQTLLRVIAGRP